jgi:hypothetical protein
LAADVVADGRFARTSEQPDNATAAASSIKPGDAKQLRTGPAPPRDLLTAIPIVIKIEFSRALGVLFGSLLLLR